MSVIVCKLPKAGLGNQLFPLLNALVFAKLNALPVVIVGYHHLKIGPYLRKEKTKRKYRGYFTFQKSLLGEQIDKCKIYWWQKKYAIVKEHPIVAIHEKDRSRKLFLFEKLPTYHDYFIHLKPHRMMVKELLTTIVNPRILVEVQQQPAPIIGVHIRMGDFRKLKQGEDFSKVGHVRTPEFYFIDIINTIRQLNGKKLPVSLFTDGYRHEFEEIFQLDDIQMVEGNADIVDLLLLSRSSMVVTANGSTFSYWAAFLSDSPIIKHPDHLYAPFRPASVNEKFYEGPLMKNEMPTLLHKNIIDL